MTKIIVREDCGNSPKNLFVQTLTIAFATGDAEFILNSVTDHVRWHMPGAPPIQSKHELRAALERMKRDPTTELVIAHVVTHGKAGAVDGVTRLASGKTNAFCHVYEFSGAKGASVSEITSYVVETK